MSKEEEFKDFYENIALFDCKYYIMPVNIEVCLMNR